jgi:hypothetical protein
MVKKSLTRLHAVYSHRRLHLIGGALVGRSQIERSRAEFRA